MIKNKFEVNKMNHKYVIVGCLLILSLLAVFMSGCLNSEKPQDDWNPLNENIKAYEVNITNLPDSSSVEHFYQVNTSIISYNSEELIEKSDAAFYGTVKEIQSSVWPTNSNDMYSSYPPIYTNITFQVDYNVKGNFSTIDVYFDGGQVDDTIVYYDGTFSLWDFKEGDKYLVYLTEYDGTYYPMWGGVFEVTD